MVSESDRCIGSPCFLLGGSGLGLEGEGLVNFKSFILELLWKLNYCYVPVIFVKTFGKPVDAEMHVVTGASF